MMKTDLTAAGYVFHNSKLLLIYHTKLNMWLPPGGHIEPNEIPDDAALREIEEETGVKARIIDALPSNVPQIMQGVKRQTAVPFYTNVHSVGDHDHYGACYLCVADSDEVKLTNESQSYRWLSREEVEADKQIRADIKAIALAAFNHFKNLHNSKLSSSL